MESTQKGFKKPAIRKSYWNISACFGRISYSASSMRLLPTSHQMSEQNAVRKKLRGEGNGLFGDEQREAKSWCFQVTSGKNLIQCKVEMSYNESGQGTWRDCATSILELFSLTSLCFEWGAGPEGHQRSLSTQVIYYINNLQYHGLFDPPGTLFLGYLHWTFSLEQVLKNDWAYLTLWIAECSPMLLALNCKNNFKSYA